MSDKKVLIFDLDDTLALSKQPVDEEMSDLLEDLIARGYIIAVTSGGSFEQFRNQFLSSLGFLPAHYESLYIMPTSGAAMYRYHLGKWINVYSHSLDEEEKSHIKSVLAKAVKDAGYWVENPTGELIEDRKTQISYSGLGQRASLDAKKEWDSNQEKRRKITSLIGDELSLYDIKMGGMTTIDVTKKGVNKALGIRELSKLLNIPIEGMLFVGDALYSGGNDEVVKETGIEAIAVSGVNETKKYLRELLGK